VSRYLLQDEPGTQGIAEAFTQPQGSGCRDQLTGGQPLRTPIQADELRRGPGGTKVLSSCTSWHGREQRRMLGLSWFLDFRPVLSAGGLSPLV
jgi:hypothetical protein